ncbi:Threonine dehydrogenase or Mannitol dehydrogenase (mdh) [Fructobacillus cardui]|uniref:zinc-binding dehydrogenase n=1 Tax=Fructobacillus cardui TaxID=2893170 RepID=UPI002DB3560D|nr:Threonine dehydrogenase or Mannitol dehydrogenase (mdh) [Fructobacillus cardui]
MLNKTDFAGRRAAYFEVAGVQETIDQAVAVTKPRGFVVVVSIFPQPIRLDIRKLMNAGVRIATSIAYSRQTFQQTVDLVTNWPTQGRTANYF